MKNIAHKQTMILIYSAIIFCAMFALLVWFLLVMKRKINHIATVKEEVASYQENKEIFAEESAQLKSLSDRVVIFETYNITTNTTPELLSSLESLANMSNIDFTITSVATPDAGTPTAKLVVDFSAKGSQTNLDKFLGKLQHQNYQVLLANLSLHRDMTTAPETPTLSDILKTNIVSTQTGWELVANMQIMSY